MFVIVGGTGHVGSAVALTLLEGQHPVTIVTRDGSKGDLWRRRGANVAVADIYDIEGMRRVFQSGKRLFLLNPPATPSTDTDAVERETIRHLLAALDGSGIEKVVAESTYGAQPGHNCGDLNTLYALEEGLKAQSIPNSVIRAAYYMSNWDGMIGFAMDDGVLPTVLPAKLKVPMVAPADLGKVAARLLTEPIASCGTHYVEGPEKYSAADVAAAFGEALGKPVRLAVTQRNDWEDYFRAVGFSDAAAHSYARMTTVIVDGKYEIPDAPVRGGTTLSSYIFSLVECFSR